MAFYKDFNKDVKDLLTKNYTDGGKWKIESKFKGPKDQVFINPQASNDGVSVDVEFNPSSCGAKTKTTVDANNNVKLNVVYEEKGHKLDAKASLAGDYEVAYEGRLGDIAVDDKLTAKATDLGVAFAFAPFQVGAGVTFAFKDSSVTWSAGVRYADAGRIASVTTKQLQTYTTGVLIPVTVADKKLSLAAQVDCGKAFSWSAGVEAPCVLIPKNAVRARINNNFKWAVAYIAKFADNWKAAVSVDDAFKVGVHFTRE